jgi:hypothetical protein
MVALLALILVGFVMATLGIALLCLGEVPFIAGKRIPALRSRLIGLVLAAFLPLALGLQQASNYLLGPNAVEGPVVTWSLFGFCWFVVLVILFRVMVPKREPRKSAKSTATTSAKNPFGAAPAEKFDVLEEVVEELEPAKKAPGKKKAPESLAWMEPEAEPEPVKKPVAKKKEPESAQQAAPTKKPSSKKAPKAPAEDENPFDFS